MSQQLASQHSSHQSASELLPVVALDTSALDGDFKAHATRGTGRYVSELWKHFQKSSSDAVTVTSFSSGAFIQQSPANRFVDFLPAGRQTVRQQLLFPLRLASRSAFHGEGSAPSFVHFPAHIDAPAWGFQRYVVTVLDLIPLVLSDLYRADRPDWRFRLARKLEIQSIRNASLILAISENTARDVNRILGIPEENIVVTPLGVDESFLQITRASNEEEIRKRFGIPAKRPIILYVGGIDQRKNMATLISSVKEVCQQHEPQSKSRPVLVMVGNIEPDLQFPLLQQRIRDEEMGEDVVMTGFVPDCDLQQIYSVATLFFFPSLYEGFGLPPLEAMASGVPVVSSNTSAMPEVLAGAAELFDPEDYKAGAASMMRVLGDVNLQSDLSAKGRDQARRFSWAATAQKTLQAYEELARRV